MLLLLVNVCRITVDLIVEAIGRWVPIHCWIAIRCGVAVHSRICWLLRRWWRHANSHRLLDSLSPLNVKFDWPFWSVAGEWIIPPVGK